MREVTRYAWGGAFGLAGFCGGNAIFPGGGGYLGSIAGFGLGYSFGGKMYDGGPWGPNPTYPYEGWSSGPEN